MYSGSLVCRRCEELGFEAFENTYGIPDEIGEHVLRHLWTDRDLWKLKTVGEAKELNVFCKMMQSCFGFYSFENFQNLTQKADTAGRQNKKEENIWTKYLVVKLDILRLQEVMTLLNEKPKISEIERNEKKNEANVLAHQPIDSHGSSTLDQTRQSPHTPLIDPKEIVTNIGLLPKTSQIAVAGTTGTTELPPMSIPDCCAFLVRLSNIQCYHAFDWLIEKDILVTHWPLFA